MTKYSISSSDRARRTLQLLPINHNFLKAFQRENGKEHLEVPWCVHDVGFRWNAEMSFCLINNRNHSNLLKRRRNSHPAFFVTWMKYKPTSTVDNWMPYNASTHFTLTSLTIISLLNIATSLYRIRLFENSGIRQRASSRLRVVYEQIVNKAQPSWQ